MAYRMVVVTETGRPALVIRIQTMLKIGTIESLPTSGYVFTLCGVLVAGNLASKHA